MNQQQDIESTVSKAATLIEALPYLQSFRGSTFLIKMGGSAMDNPELVRKVMRDIVFLEVAGINPVVVHGGGKAISAAMKESGLEAKFIGGFRVTTPEAIDIVEKTLTHILNPGLVDMLHDFGGRAAGIPGHTVFTGQRIQGIDENGQPQDIGRVGEVTDAKLESIRAITEREMVPVISPLAREKGSDKLLNINADLAAAALAKRLKVSKLIYLSDVPGVMEDPADENTIISTITPDLAHQLINRGVISGGMLPKINSALDALDHGVEKVHFIDGRQPHSLLLEIFTKSGIGTQIKQ